MDEHGVSHFWTNATKDHGKGNTPKLGEQTAQFEETTTGLVHQQQVRRKFGWPSDTPT